MTLKKQFIRVLTFGCALNASTSFAMDMDTADQPLGYQHASAALPRIASSARVEAGPAAPAVDGILDALYSAGYPRESEREFREALHELSPDVQNILYRYRECFVKPPDCYAVSRVQETVKLLSQVPPRELQLLVEAGGSLFSRNFSQYYVLRTIELLSTMPRERIEVIARLLDTAVDRNSDLDLRALVHGGFSNAQIEKLTSSLRNVEFIDALSAYHLSCLIESFCYINNKDSVLAERILENLPILFKRVKGSDTACILTFLAKKPYAEALFLKLSSVFEYYDHNNHGDIFYRSLLISNLDRLRIWEKYRHSSQKDMDRLKDKLERARILADGIDHSYGAAYIMASIMRCPLEKLEIILSCQDRIFPECMNGQARAEVIDKLSECEVGMLPNIVTVTVRILETVPKVDWKYRESKRRRLDELFSTKFNAGSDVSMSNVSPRGDAEASSPVVFVGSVNSQPPVGSAAEEDPDRAAIAFGTSPGDESEASGVASGHESSGSSDGSGGASLASSLCSEDEEEMFHQMCREVQQEIISQFKRMSHNRTKNQKKNIGRRKVKNLAPESVFRRVAERWKQKYGYDLDTSTSFTKKDVPPISEQ